MCDTMVIDWIWKWHPLTFLYQPLKFSLKWGIWESQKLKKLLSQDFLGYKRLSNPSQSVSLQRNQHGLRNSNGWITSKRVQGYPKRIEELISGSFASVLKLGHRWPFERGVFKVFNGCHSKSNNNSNQVSGLLYADTCLKGILLLHWCCSCCLFFVYLFVWGSCYASLFFR